MASAIAARVAADQGEVGGADGGVGAGADRHAEVGLGEGGGVVDPVADEHGRLPVFLQSPDDLGLAVGPYAGEHVGVGDADLPGHRRRGALVVPGEQDGTQAQARAAARRRRPRPAAARSATTSAARAWPSQPTRTAVRPVVRRGVDGVAQRGGHLERQLGEQPRAAHGDVPVPDAAPHSGPGQGGEPGDLRQAAEPGGGLAGDRLADRVLGAVFDRAGQQQRLLCSARVRRAAR